MSNGFVGRTDRRRRPPLKPGRPLGLGRAAALTLRREGESPRRLEFIEAHASDGAADSARLGPQRRLVEAVDVARRRDVRRLASTAQEAPRVAILLNGGAKDGGVA